MVMVVLFHLLKLVGEPLQYEVLIIFNEFRFLTPSARAHTHAPVEMSVITGTVGQTGRGCRFFLSPCSTVCLSLSFALCLLRHSGLLRAAARQQAKPSLILPRH